LRLKKELHEISALGKWKYFTSHVSEELKVADWLVICHGASWYSIVTMLQELYVVGSDDINIVT
jgi:hypothetical protein